MVSLTRRLMTWGLAVLLAGAAAGVGTGARSDPSWQSARPDYEWSFPADHWSHAGTKTEWWYFTGHLQDVDDPAQRFGYQFTFFRVGLLPESPRYASHWSAGDLVMGHASISDLTGQEHVFSEVLYRAIPLLGGFGAPGDSIIAWSLAPAGSDGRWVLSPDGAGFSLRMCDEEKGMSFALVVQPAKSLVFQGPNGYSRKGDAPGAASQYYSFTRLETVGTVRLGGRIRRVTGQSWMDREFGSNQLAAGQVGWDWFGLQLDDGREVMLYLLRDESGEVDFARGTLIERDGDARYLAATDWRLETLSSWISPQTRTRYPSRWRLRLPAAGLDLDIVPLLPEQENVSRRSGGLHYWEGAVAVRPAGKPSGPDENRAIGRGYVELTGYGKGSRPPI
jgi:predicted secreted hydrolase